MKKCLRLAKQLVDWISPWGKNCSYHCYKTGKAPHFRPKAWQSLATSNDTIWHALNCVLICLLKCFQTLSFVFQSSPFSVRCVEMESYVAVFHPIAKKAQISERKNMKAVYWYKTEKTHAQWHVYNFSMYIRWELHSGWQLNFPQQETIFLTYCSICQFLVFDSRHQNLTPTLPQLCSSPTLLWVKRSQHPGQQEPGAVPASDQLCDRAKTDLPASVILSTIWVFSTDDPSLFWQAVMCGEQSDSSA